MSDRPFVAYYIPVCPEIRAVRNEPRFSLRMGHRTRPNVDTKRLTAHTHRPFRFCDSVCALLFYPDD